MVCISCIVIPVLLWLWHRFLQPVVLKFYNPWAKLEKEEAEGQTLTPTQPSEGPEGVSQESENSTKKED